jgi:hypothetical protein
MVTVPMLQFLQASPQARRDVSALLSVPRVARKKSKNLNAGLVATGTGSNDKIPTTTTPFGSFYQDTWFQSTHRDWRLFRRTVIDYGLDVNLIILKTLERLGVSSKSIKGTSFDKFSYTPVTGPEVRLRRVADVQLKVGGVETKVQFFVIPAYTVGNTGYSALLGLPWLMQSPVPSMCQQ